MATAAEQSTAFHSTFVPLLNNLDEVIQGATKPSDLDEALQAVVDARSTLQERDREAPLTKRDREQYERRLAKLQSQVISRRSALQPASSSSRFAFRRGVAKPAESEAFATPSFNLAMSPAPSPPHEQADAMSGPGCIQVTLQTNRLITFRDLAKASSGEPLSLSLSHLTDCIVDFRAAQSDQPQPHIVALTATNLKRCAVLLPSIDGSLMLTRLEDSLLVVASCRQLRVYSSKRTAAAISADKGGVASPMTLESCEAMRVTRGVEVQDFDEPGAGPSKDSTKSWQPLEAQDEERIQAFAKLDTPTTDRLADVLGHLFTPAASSSSSSSALQPPSTPQYLADDSGVLLVFSDPGRTSTLAEFHDWYDAEHVPMRVEGFVEFASAARYSSKTLANPSTSSAPAFDAGWGAAYTISSNALYNDARYVGLRSNRSPREADLVKRLGVLDRRIYKTLGDSACSKEPRGDVRPQSKERVEEEAWHVEVTSFDTDKSEAEVGKWFADEARPALLAQGTGVSRCRLLLLADALINGVDVAKENGDAKSVPRWTLFVEYRKGVDAKAPVTASIVKLPTREGAGLEVRMMTLYRAWDPVKAMEQAQTS